MIRVEHLELKTKLTTNQGPEPQPLKAQPNTPPSKLDETIARNSNDTSNANNKLHHTVVTSSNHCNHDGDEAIY